MQGSVDQSGCNTGAACQVAPPGGQIWNQYKISFCIAEEIIKSRKRVYTRPGSVVPLAMLSFLATIVALHFAPVSGSVSR